MLILFITPISTWFQILLLFLVKAGDLSATDMLYFVLLLTFVSFKAVHCLLTTVGQNCVFLPFVTINKVVFSDAYRGCSLYNHIYTHLYLLIYTSCVLPKYSKYISRHIFTYIYINTHSYTTYIIENTRALTGHFFP